jgi:hypothetical protein
LPNNADELARSVLQTVHSLIEKHDIQPKNIINLDQVPRFFETEPTSTIAARGSRSGVLRKGGTLHKRFTAWFYISANGMFLKWHILFSGLKNKPNVNTRARRRQ